MTGNTISHYKILEQLPSMEFILSEVEGLRTSPSTGLRTGGGGGNPVITGQALPTDRDKLSRTSLHQEISE